MLRELPGRLRPAPAIGCANADWACDAALKSVHPEASDTLGGIDRIPGHSQIAALRNKSVDSSLAVARSVPVSVLLVRRS